MSTTGIILHEEWDDGDPNVTIVPGSGEAYWFKDFIQSSTHWQSSMTYVVADVTASEVVASWDVDRDGVELSTTHALFIRRFQSSSSAAYSIQHLAGIVIPEGCDLTLSEGITTASEFVTVLGIGAVIDGTDEVFYSEWWEDGDPDTTLVPAADHYVRWDMYALLSNVQDQGLDITVNRVVGNDGLFGTWDFFAHDTQNSEMKILREEDRSATSRTAADEPRGMVIPAGYDMTISDSMTSAGNRVATLFVGREYNIL